MRLANKPIVFPRHSLDSDFNLRKQAHSTDCADCACSVFQMSEYSIFDPQCIDSKWIRNTPTYTQKLTDEYLVSYGPFHDIVILNYVTEDLLNLFEEPRKLPEVWGESDVTNVVSQLIGAGLIKPYCSQASSLTERPETLSVWLHTTDRCNLRCRYCYLPHVKKDMSMQVGMSAIDAAYRSATKNAYKRIKFKYSGGEALLNLPLILRLHKYACEQSQFYKIGVSGVVLSNGTLVDAQSARLLASHELELVISLDGLDSSHDLQRPYAGGRGSFVDVKKGIEVALDHGVELGISITVTTRNATALGSLAKWILELDIPFSLNFYRENDLSIPEKGLSLHDETIIAGMLAAYAEIEANMPRHSLLNSIIDRANLSAPHLKTCGVGNNYLVFDYQGNVSKCQMRMDSVVTDSKVEDPLLHVRLDTIGISNISVEDKEGCSTCEWQYWCAGGCPEMTHRVTGRYDTRSPYCNIYKAIYPAAMRLEGLRLLKLAIAAQNTAT